MALPKRRRDGGLGLRGRSSCLTCAGSGRVGSLNRRVAVIVIGARAPATDAAGAASALREATPGSSSASAPCSGEREGWGKGHGENNQDCDKLWSFQVASFRRSSMQWERLTHDVEWAI